MTITTQPMEGQGTPSIDLAETERFLATLGGLESKFVFQTFENNATKEATKPKVKHADGQARVLYGTLDKLSKTLSNINNSHSGVFVTINESDGGRKVESITKVRAVFADWDDVGTGLPAIEACGLKPHIIVESSAGKFHAYWLVSDCTLGEFKPIQKAIAEKLGSDPAIIDLPRVMRLAGFSHHKYADSPYFQTRIVELNKIEVYTVSEIKAGLGLDLNPAQTTTPNALHNNKKSLKNNNIIKNNSIDKIKSALEVFPIEYIDNRDTWLRTALCMHSVDNDLLPIWLEWSRKSEKFDEANAIYTWNSLGEKDNGITIASLYYDAKGYGWVDESRPEKFTVTVDGVFFNGIDKDGQPLAPELVCSMLQVLGSTSAANKEGWGRYLEFSDRSGMLHRWAMPMTMMASEGTEYRSELLRLGLEIAPTAKAKTRLSEFITSAPADKHYTCIEKTGWHRKSYVLPHKTIGADEVLFQSTGGLHHAYSIKGTPHDWPNHVAKLCAGNTRLVFAISCAFAAPLLHLLGLESGGFHFRGDSSCGKTTALRVAGSVWGGLDYMQRWRATDNGLESVAALHNDGLLVLDELSQCDPKMAGQVAYMLANGSAKVRGSRTLTPRACATWRLLYLSAGEISLSQHMQTVGLRSKAGQEIRLIDIPANAGKGFGLFDTLHTDEGGSDTGAGFSKLLVDNCTKYYGRAGSEYLENLCATIDNDNTPEKLRLHLTKLTKELLPANASGQASRGAERFALVAIAGELATRFGLTGWKVGEAELAATVCFNAWINSRGGAGNHEALDILSQVASFFEAHGESRFTPIEAIGERTTINRAGFREVFDCAGDTSYTIYYCLPEAFTSELCKGYDTKQVTAVLKDSGWLQTGRDGKNAQLKTIRGMGRTRLYCITPRS